ncbi:CCA tRNA nucleotidyltransferase [Roseobacter sinensis]|uniref:CCA tRNA nucleotidyltransferase n=1 Tax=Roseobacter sinensis TaxID=2931391 RepID=A0ABT3B914_9RHOB|nr:CCA tRNA nucleotidyltransferase [Roseobacter sp. WL0113]MCV3270033.1 CCA tRNA nucleotidyltransferase [Roseobacter sp. WL0113]
MIPPETDWLTDASVQTVCRAIAAEGAPVYMVGGCVRDAVLRLSGSDVDMATPARPQEVTRLAEAAGLKVVPTGIDHGTVTVVVDGTGFEVTTFRKDVQTDGRRAVVAFSEDIAEDARRRDFTLNALYATPQGQIVDPLGGLPDCLARRIRFIENADDRIREDYLRILRFFRFHAWYADAAKDFDADTLHAIASNASGLETLSAERVGQEVRRLLAAPDPVPALATMQQAGVVQRILPGADLRLIGPAVHLEAELGLTPDWLLRLAALGDAEAAGRLRLSRKQAAALEDMQRALGEMMPVREVAYRYGYEMARRILILRAALSGEGCDRDALDPLKDAAAARLPVSAKDFMPGLSGKALGAHLARLEARWIASDFRLTREELMTGT